MIKIENLLTDNKYQIKYLENTCDGREVIGVDPQLIAETVSCLKSDENTRFDMLFSITGVDKVNSIELLYHLYSTFLNRELIIKTVISSNNPEIKSLSEYYSSANWHEREVYDLLGVIFKDHPDLERILLPKDWQGHPLRKNYENKDERLSWNER